MEISFAMAILRNPEFKDSGNKCNQLNVGKGIVFLKLAGEEFMELFLSLK